MIISAAAAARLFLKIAALELRPEFKLDILTTVSAIIEGRLDISAADYFYLPQEKEIGRELAKAIVRSARARAAAARRRARIADAETTASVATTETVVVESDSGEKISDDGYNVVASATDSFDELSCRPSEIADLSASAPDQSGKKRRKRRRRHKRS
ncbi:MAG: hypothetical protein K2K55_10000 [Duncaniella sp.]|nr:hypothetical protein [Duncaniella sp.]